MKYRNHVIVLVVGVGAFAAGRWAPSFEPVAQGQPDKKAPGGAAPAGGQPMGAPPVAPELKALEVFAGDWTGSVKMWMDPAAPPRESTGTIHREWILDGHYLSELIEGAAAAPGEPAYEGHAIMTYNPIEKRYEAGWIDNMSSWITTTTGAYDSGKKAFTFTGDAMNGMTGKREKHRDVVDVSNPDHHVYTTWTTGPDGKEFKAFEGTFDRVKK
jgi:hypothetical protein